MTREEAVTIIQAFKFIVGTEDYSDRLEIAIDKAIEALQEEERPHGEWKFIGDNLLACTECGYVNDATWLGNWRLRTCDSTYPHACPNCGAYMKKEGESE